MSEIETRDQVGTDSRSTVKYWKIELDSAHKQEKEYRTKAAELLDKYTGKDAPDFNILWSNVETLKPVVYSNTAQPDVRRRWKSANPVGKQVAMVLERALKYNCEQYNFDETIENIRDEMLISGRGVARVEYEMEEAEVDQQTVVIGEDGFPRIETQKVPMVAKQELTVKYVNYEDFRMSPAKCWEDVRWIAFRHLPTRDELVANFGDKGQKVPLGYSLLESKDNKALQLEDGGDDVFKRAEVWEIWDKETRKRTWLATDYPELLKEEEDPYDLYNFWPMPKPLYAFQAPGTMVPRAEYEMYRKQVETLNSLSKKIDELTRELKLAGIYNAVNKEAKKLLSAKSGQFIGITTPDIGASIKDMIAFWPVQEVAAVLVNLINMREDQLKLIYQITGLSDIVRGSTAASETATAQQIKGNFANMRMQPRQKPIQTFIRDIFRIKCEIIAEKYTLEILQQITQLEVTPEMIEMMRSDKLRDYNIDVETDSTVQPDADSEQKRRSEFLVSVQQFLNGIAPMVQGGILDKEVAKQMLMFGARGFKVGRELEDALESIGDVQEGQQQEPQPDPAMEQMKAEMQMQMQKMQQEMQLEMAKLQQQGQIKQAELQQDGAIARAEMQQDAQIEREKIAMDAATKRQAAAMNAQVKASQQARVVQ